MALERKPTGAYDAAYPLSIPGISGTGYAQAVVVLDASGNAAPIGSKQETFTLANNVSTAGDYPATPGGSTFGQVVYGGDYVWTVLGTLGSGGSAQLKSVIRNANGGIVGTQNIGAAKTAADTNGGTGVGLGSNAEVFVTLTGTALSGVTVQISRLPA
jgi:hypothetical protein